MIFTAELLENQQQCCIACYVGIDKHKFICKCQSNGSPGRMMADLTTNGNPTCDEQKLVAQYDGIIDKNLCGTDTKDILTSGDRIIIALKDYQNPSFFDESGECSCSDHCKCSYTACCVAD
ncbi:hypothetical protein E2C01_036993 [Portunus trituberculatus]|uniref:Uncharacterized protein n=1 Tax=Portunus trituberculatus TaxID=210409 RepID=A0A5B7FE68_PORTR|nr:hypothetical protein [Portunus trituberculatus]